MSEEQTRHWVVELRELTSGESSYGDLIDLSIGEPDGGPPEAVNQLLKLGGESWWHRYPPGFGTPSLRAQIAQWLHQQLKLDFDPSEVVVTHGAKLAIALAPLVFTNVGGVVVAPTPGYPTYHAAAERCGRVVRWLPLPREAGFLPTRETLVRTLTGAQLVFLGYPANPTGALATRAFLETLVDVARETGTTIIHDAAYIELVHDVEKTPPLSIFHIDGAEDVALEVHSLSKTFHLAGWRLGFVVGRSARIRRFARALSVYDSGATPASQAIAECALREAPNFAAQRRPRDRARTQQVVTGLEALGCDVFTPSGAFYVWCRPPQHALDRDLGWRAIVGDAGIACAPGRAFGPAGDEYIRFACVQPPDVYDEVFLRLAELWS